MKKSNIIILLTAIGILFCTMIYIVKSKNSIEIKTKTETPKQKTINIKTVNEGFYNIVVIDSCEYLAYKWAGADGHFLTHKGNCKFCAKRK